MKFYNIKAIENGMSSTEAFEKFGVLWCNV